MDAYCRDTPWILLGDKFLHKNDVSVMTWHGTLPIVTYWHIIAVRLTLLKLHSLYLVYVSSSYYCKLSLILLFYLESRFLAFLFCFYHALRETTSLATGLTESLFLVHKDEYPEHEQASLRQLYQAKVSLPPSICICVSVFLIYLFLSIYT